MAKPIIFGEREATASPSPPWQQTNGMYLAGKAALDEADKLAVEMERKWGCGRLRLLVGAELREKFDRQRYLLNQAVWHGDLETLRVQSQRMCSAWRALDAAAMAQGSPQTAVEVWEVVLDNGSVAALVRGSEEASYVHSNSDRMVAVYTLAEIGRLISGFPAIAKAKEIFPGASVERVREITDPLDAIHDTKGGLDDELPF